MWNVLALVAICIAVYAAFRAQMPTAITGKLRVTCYTPEGEPMADVSVQPMRRGNEPYGDPAVTNKEGEADFAALPVGYGWKAQGTSKTGQVAWSDEFNIVKNILNFAEIHFAGDAAVKFHAESNSIPTPNVAIKVEQ